MGRGIGHAGVLLAVALAVSGSAASKSQPPSLIFYNGTVLTMEKNPARAQAIAVRGGRILAVGSNARILRLAGPRTKQVNLGKTTLLPGFVDAHDHVFLEATLGIQLSTFEEGENMVLANGITARGEMQVTPTLLQQVKDFAAAGKLRVRTSLYPIYADPCGQVLGHWYPSPITRPTAMLRIPGVKLWADGGACGRPAVSWTYPNREGGAGDLWFTREQLTRIVTDVRSRGFQIAIHALGDRAVDAALGAIQSSLGSAARGLRPRIEHAALLRPEQLGRFSQVGALPVLFGDFATCAFDRGGFARGDLLPQTVSYLWRWRGLLAANPGLRVAWHSDWPVLSINPFEHLYGFVTRRDRDADGSVCQPEPEIANDTIPVARALRMMTIDAAYALGVDPAVGSLRPGKLADLVVVSRNPLSVGLDRIPDIHVLVTVVGGKTRFCAEGIARLCPG